MRTDLGYRPVDGIAIDIIMRVFTVLFFVILAFVGWPFWILAGIKKLLRG